MRNVIFPRETNTPVVGTAKADSDTLYVSITSELQCAEDSVISSLRPIFLCTNRRMMERIWCKIDLHVHQRIYSGIVKWDDFVRI